MENPGFEMEAPGLARSKEEWQKKSGKSLLRFFLLCLGASILSTSMGILVLSLVCGGKNSQKMPENSQKFPKNSRNVEIPEGFPEEGKVEAKFQFLLHMRDAKIHQFPGGEMRWARFWKDPQEYKSAEMREFGSSLNSRRSQISAAMLRIHSRGLRAPHWHLNANGHGLLLQGSAWIGIIGPDSSNAVTFNASVGQVLFFPRNSLHWVLNVGSEDLLILLFFSTHEDLQTLHMDEVFYSTPEDVAARALKPEGGVKFIRTFQKPEEAQAINLPQTRPGLIPNSSFSQSPDSQVCKFFYDLPASPEFPFPGGSFRWARFRKNGTGLTENQQIYSQSLHEHENSLTLATLRIFGNHLGTPHFHSNANEMGVVLSGCGQVGLTLPEGHLQFPVGIDDVVFFPLGSQHFIQSFCQEDLLVALAYNTGNQLETLRMNQYFHGTPEHILAQLFHKDPAEFQKIPKNSP